MIERFITPRTVWGYWMIKPPAQVQAIIGGLLGAGAGKLVDHSTEGALGGATTGALLGLMKNNPSAMFGQRLSPLANAVVKLQRLAYK
jgi:hypothetical protein